MAVDPRRAPAGRDDVRVDERVVIKVRDNGPYKVTGPIELIDADGNRFAVEGDRPIALCLRAVADEAVLRRLAQGGGVRCVRARRGFPDAVKRPRSS